MAYQNDLLVPGDGALNGFNRFTTTREYNLGETRFDNTGKKYRYVQFKDAVTYAAGHCLDVANTAWTAVTNDRSGGSAIGTQTAFGGVCLGAPTQNSYGWVQVGGIATVLGDGSVAAGEAVVLHSVDGQADTMAAGEEHQVFGTALEADDATTALFACRLLGY